MAEQESKDSGGATVAEQVLSIMEIILDESNAEPLSEDKVRGCLQGWWERQGLGCPLPPLTPKSLPIFCCLPGVLLVRFSVRGWCQLCPLRENKA